MIDSGFEKDRWTLLAKQEFKKQNPEYIEAFKDSFQRYEEQYHFISGKEILSKNSIAKEIIKTRELEEDKIKPVELLTKELNKKQTMVAILGRNGSGKTTVLNLSRKSFETADKLQKWTKIALLYTLFIFNIISFAWFFSGFKTNEWINKKISINRNKYIHINIWNLFGMRNHNDYNGMESGYAKYEGVNKHIETFSSDKDKPPKASHLFIKRTLWKAILHKYDSNKFLYHKIRKSLTFDRRQPIITTILAYLSMLLLFIVLPLSITIPTTIIDKDFLINKNYKVIVQILINGIPVIVSTFLSVIIFIKKTHKKKCINKFLADPSNNALMVKMLQKMSKRNFLILHFSEIDRLNSWIKREGGGKHKNISGNIIEQIGLLYEAGNLNVVVELTPTLINDWQNKKTNFYDCDDEGDLLKKLFSEVVEVKKISLDSLIERAAKNNINYMRTLSKMKRTFLVYWFNYLENNNTISWRNEPYLINELKDLSTKFKNGNLSFMKMEDMKDFLDLILRIFIEKNQMLETTQEEDYSHQISFNINERFLGYNINNVKPKKLDNWLLILGTLTLINDPETYFEGSEESTISYIKYYNLDSVFKGNNSSREEGFALFKSNLLGRRINIAGWRFNTIIYHFKENLNDMFGYIIKFSNPEYFWKNSQFTDYLKSLSKKEVREFFKKILNNLSYSRHYKEIIEYGDKNNFARSECKAKKGK